MSKAMEANLNTIARGEVNGLFEREIQRVVENIRDVNTDPKAKRKIVLEFDCTPYPDRSGFNVAVAVKSKLQAPNGVNSTVFIGRDAGHYRAFTQDVRQGDLFDADASNDEEQQAAPATTKAAKAN